MPCTALWHWLLSQWVPVALPSPCPTPCTPLHPGSTAVVAAAHEQLEAALGPERAAPMGLLSCGAAACCALLNETEEAALEAGMREFGRAFHTIRAELLPGRTVFELQNYYYNVRRVSGLAAGGLKEGGGAGGQGRAEGSQFGGAARRAAVCLPCPLCLPAHVLLPHPTCALQVWKLQATPRAKAW